MFYMPLLWGALEIVLDSIGTYSPGRDLPCSFQTFTPLYSFYMEKS